MCFKNLAGAEGLEPSHAGIKIQCLNQLGDAPTLVADQNFVAKTTKLRSTTENHILLSICPAFQRMLH